MLYTSFNSPRLPNFHYGDDCSMSDSSLALEGPAAFFECGDDTQLREVRIIVRGSGKLRIGVGCELRGTIIVDDKSEIVIGDGLICNDLCKFHASDGTRIEIGNDCLFANVAIYSSDMHGIFSVEDGRRINTSADVAIDARVWIARDAVILKGTKIGADSVVAAGAVVGKRFSEANCLIGGAPAKLLRAGIRWDRAMDAHHKLQLPVTFSAARFKSRARRFDHVYVLSHGMPLLHLYPDANTYNVYLFYYTARSLFDLHFKNEDVRAIDYAGQSVTLDLLHDVMQHCYLTSAKRNTACGAYLLAAKVKLEMADTHALHVELMAATEHAAKRIRGLLGMKADFLFSASEIAPK
ncbi:acyltransferase [Noviherbaspirillum sp. 1P10PC]|uniref:acyltransferase n=1 Tax=Noviherbaspirillum sp. 1P10PC TaxID=3132292 RepID=UPI0039A3ADE2